MNPLNSSFPCCCVELVLKVFPFCTLDGNYSEDRIVQPRSTSVEVHATRRVA